MEHAVILSKTGSCKGLQCMPCLCVSSFYTNFAKKDTPLKPQSGRRRIPPQSLPCMKSDRRRSRTDCPAGPEPRSFEGTDLRDTLAARVLANRLERAAGLMGGIDLTRRRILNQETVPASEKIACFFEERTDILVKGGRDTLYGHKVFLSGGAATLIFGFPDRALQPRRRRVRLAGQSAFCQRASGPGCRFCQEARPVRS